MESFKITDACLYPETLTYLVPRGAWALVFPRRFSPAAQPENTAPKEIILWTDHDWWVWPEFLLEVGTQQRKSRGINLGSLQLQTSFFLLFTGMMPTPTVSTSFSSKLHGARKCSRLPVMEHSSSWHKVGIQQIFVEWMDFALNRTFPGSSNGVIMTWASWALNQSGSGIFTWALTSSTCPLPTPQLNPRAIHLPSCKRIVFILYTGLYVWNVFPVKHAWAWWTKDTETLLGSFARG